MNRDTLIDAALWAVFIAAAATAVAVVWTTPVFAHEWYPPVCCSERDCFEVAPELMTPTADGYRYEITGEVIPYDRTRVTPPEGGGAFHICTYGGNPSGQIIGRTMSDGMCAWVPQFGS